MSYPKFLLDRFIKLIMSVLGIEKTEIVEAAEAPVASEAPTTEAATVEVVEEVKKPRRRWLRTMLGIVAFVFLCGPVTFLVFTNPWLLLVIPLLLVVWIVRRRIAKRRAKADLANQRMLHVENLENMLKQAEAALRESEQGRRDDAKRFAEELEAAVTNALAELEQGFQVRLEAARSDGIQSGVALGEAKVKTAMETALAEADKAFVKRMNLACDQVRDEIEKGFKVRLSEAKLEGVALGEKNLQFAVEKAVKEALAEADKAFQTLLDQEKIKAFQAGQIDGKNSIPVTVTHKPAARKAAPKKASTKKAAAKKSSKKKDAKK